MLDALVECGAAASDYDIADRWRLCYKQLRYDSNRRRANGHNVTGGEPVPADTFAEVCLVGTRGYRRTRWCCTGVLVHPRLVLTAGHCKKPGLAIDMVALNASDAAHLSDAEIVRAARIVVHPIFTQTLRHYDLAVILLEHESRTPPASIATATEFGRASAVTLVGFGSTRNCGPSGFGIKRRAIAAVQPFNSHGLWQEHLASLCDPHAEFVAGGNGVDTCVGDSGGPAYVRVGNEYRLAGVTSRQASSIERPCGEGGVYSRVDTSLDFLGEVASTNGIVL